MTEEHIHLLWRAKRRLDAQQERLWAAAETVLWGVFGRDGDRIAHGLITFLDWAKETGRPVSVEPGDVRAAVQRLLDGGGEG
jgi:hypothetical protein